MQIFTNHSKENTLTIYLISIVYYFVEIYPISLPAYNNNIKIDDYSGFLYSTIQTFNTFIFFL